MSDRGEPTTGVERGALERALAAADAALATGDVDAAAEAVRAAVAALPSTGPLAGAELARLRELHRRCLERAEVAQERLAEATGQAARSRRAAAAYRAIRRP